MAVAEDHPRAEELAAFPLGALADDTGGPVATHVPACETCQAAAAAAPADSLVELLRRADARSRAHPPAAGETPAPNAAAASTVIFAPEAAPPELAGHERYGVVRRLG